MMKSSDDLRRIRVMGPDLKWLIRINLIRITGCLPDAFSTGMAGAFLFPMIAGL